MNRKRIFSADLCALSKRLVDICRQYQADLISVHISKAGNTLADRLSTFNRTKDEVDWMLCDRAFESTCHSVNRRFGVVSMLDECADAIGRNSRVPAFCSTVDSVLDMDLFGEHMCCDPDFGMNSKVASRFVSVPRLLHAGRAEHLMHIRVESLDGQTIWKLSQGSGSNARYESVVLLFMSPDWRRFETGEEVYEFQYIPRLF